MIRFARVYRALGEQGLNIPLAEAKRAFNSIDQDKLEERVRSRFRYRVWDGVSPINGVSPDEVRRAKGLTADQAAYLVFIDGKLVIFQGHHFRTGAPLAPTTVEAAAKEDVDALVEQVLVGELVDEVLEAL